MDSHTATEGSDTAALQQQIERLADELLARGIRPTAGLLESHVAAPRHQLADALERWARRVGEDPPASIASHTNGGMHLVAGLQRGTRLDNFTRAALIAGREAASKKADALRRTRREELLVEIERASEKLARLEERVERGDEAPHLGKQIEKTRDRLEQMREAARKLE